MGYSHDRHYVCSRRGCGWLGIRGMATARKAKGDVYIARTITRRLYVGQTNNFRIRAAQHARAGKISSYSRRIQIPIHSKRAKNFTERTLYYSFGGKPAPWLANKIRPHRWR